MIKELREYHELLFALTYRDIRVKYKQAVMGIAWAFFLPVLAIASGIVFRVVMSIFSGKPLELASIVGVMVKSVPWILFAAIVGGASNSLIANIGLITKIYFPRHIVPLSGVLSALFDFLISVAGLILVITLMVVLIPIANPQPTGEAASFVQTTNPTGVTLSWSLLLVPVVIGLLVIMATGLGMFLGAANLFFRDVKYIVGVILQFGLFFSLVYFTYEELGQYGWVLLLNPVAPLLESLRCLVVNGAMDPFLWPWVGYSTIVALLALLLGSIFFEKAEHLFAEYA
ncbi:MAG: ABC transporter permease [Phycisphaeraceae bacterium]